MRLNDLNNEQHQAVETTEGPLMIVAGPGTGKTKTLTARIAYLLESGNVKPQEILALTFTNKAAAEMRRRIAAQLPADTPLPKVTTFHALCYELLTAQQAEPITFITEPERLQVIKNLRLSKQFKGLSTRELALEVSRLKNQSPHRSQNVPLSKLVEEYNAILNERDLFDFDDLLQQTYQLLKTTQPQFGYTYILVDEFQDTNSLQYELLLLLRKNDNLCVIGDPLQAIYGFRGASSGIFERFKADFPHHRTLTLTINYRSTPQVVALANAVFTAAPQLHPYSSKLGEAKTVEVLNEYTEAAWIVTYIEEAIGGSDFLRSHQTSHAPNKAQNFRDFAILYRTHHVGKIVKRTLVESGIPCQIAGEDSPYEQPIVQAIITILKYLDEPNTAHRSFLGLSNALKAFSSGQIDTLLNSLQTKRDVPLTELAYTIGATFNFDQKELSGLTSTLVRFEKQSLKKYLTYLDELNENNFYDPQADAVGLMTIHAAKGLEFKHVFVIGCEDGIMPYARREQEPNIDEEKRLFYVAVTRAKETIHLLHARKRAGEVAKLSPFIDALPPEVLSQTIDAGLDDQVKRHEKRQAKRKQATLFDL